jgi:hypothetical protein
MGVTIVANSRTGDGKNVRDGWYVAGSVVQAM